ncbi:MAG: PTS sugar transporter subunit IIA [Fusobacteriaceae bacterium]|mgnify:FL=1|nr:PTS sugar transporter subunit IIA [Fusobacteriaceae bacterium]
MKLSSYLDEKFIFEDVDGENLDQVIKNVVKELSKCDKVINRNKEMVEEALLKREHEISTAIGNGIAIPHARICEYDDVSVVIAKLAKPIDAEISALHSNDKVDLIFMIIAGKTKNKRVLKLMSSISILAQNVEFLDKIRKEKNIKDIIEIIENNEVEVKDTITAQDIMCPELIPAKLSDTLEEVAKRLIVENRAGLPVIDSKGLFVGEITEKELIEFGMPKYTSLMNDLSFMTIGEPFEEYFKNEHLVTVNELYRKTAEIIDRKSSIMEICFLMVSKGNTRLYVVENGTYFGTIFRSDIIKKVLHI